MNTGTREEALPSRSTDGQGFFASSGQGRAIISENDSHFGQSAWLVRSRGRVRRAGHSARDVQPAVVVEGRSLPWLSAVDVLPGARRIVDRREGDLRAVPGARRLPGLCAQCWAQPRRDLGRHLAAGAPAPWEGRVERLALKGWRRVLSRD